MYSRLVASGACLPARVVSNDELATRLDTSDEWIRTRTGITQRHIADASQTTSDLAAAAARVALGDAGVAAAVVDLIVVATSTPDMIFPSTACAVQAKLGALRAFAFDVQAVCCGFVYALDIADKYIRSGQCRTALVIGAEIFSRILDWNDRSTCVLFGDGAGAVLLRADSTPGIYASCLHADGSQADILCVPGGVAGGAVVGSPFVHMDGGAVYKLAVRVLAEVTRETCTAAGFQLADIDWLIAHQANRRILDATARKLGLPAERAVVTVDRHANTSAASIPLALDVARRDGRIRPGDIVALAGVGAGFTWGASLVEM
jgi:3-oxoacyl-[acyl-carrier-protein] synthase-3